MGWQLWTLRSGRCGSDSRLGFSDDSLACKLEEILCYYYYICNEGKDLFSTTCLFLLIVISPFFSLSFGHEIASPLEALFSTRFLHHIKAKFGQKAQQARIWVVLTFVFSGNWWE
jgi:hypothetical protein